MLASRKLEDMLGRQHNLKDNVSWISVSDQSVVVGSNQFRPQKCLCQEILVAGRGVLRSPRWLKNRHALGIGCVCQGRIYDKDIFPLQLQHIWGRIYFGHVCVCLRWNVWQMFLSELFNAFAKYFCLPRVKCLTMFFVSFVRSSIHFSCILYVYNVYMCTAPVSQQSHWITSIVSMHNPNTCV